MAMSIDQALQYPGELVAVWDEAGGGGRLLICAVADGRLGVLATAELPAAERAERTALLRARGVRIGATERRGPYYWSRDGGFTVWSLLETVVDSRDDRLWVAGRGELERAEAALVVSFLGKSLGHRGVLVVTGDGRELVIAEEHDPAADLDPAYGRADAVADAAWGSCLGRELAAWLGVPHRDDLP